MKTFIANQKIFGKLLVAPILVLLLLIVLSGFSYRELSNQRRAIQDLYDVRFKNYQDISRVINRITALHSNAYKILSWSEASFSAERVEPLIQEQSAGLKEVRELLQMGLQSNVLGDKEKILYTASLKEMGDYEKAISQVIDMVSSDLSLATSMMIPAENEFQSVDKNLRELWELEKELSKRSYDFSLESFNAVLKIFVLVLGIAVAISLIVSILMARLITSPIKETVRVIKKMAQGDLTQEISLSTKDEIGVLTRSINEMRQKTEEAVGQSTVMSQELSNAASAQASSLEEASSSLEEMTSMVKQTAGNATDANNLMTAGQQIIKKANVSMDELTESMKEIAVGSEETNKIIKTIDEIAFQTNLLALNAAVEAARAGEAGSGFAVVADEVRNLAVRAAEAAKNTSSLIEAISKKIKKGENLVGVTNDSFKEITESSTKVVTLIGEIASASQEQSNGIDQINRAVADMNSLTQQNAAGAEELASIMAMFRTGHDSSEISRNKKKVIQGKNNDHRGKKTKGNGISLLRGINGDIRSP